MATWTTHNGWLGVLGPARTTNGPGQYATTQARLLGAGYHHIASQDDRIPTAIIAHHHEDSVAADAGLILEHLKIHKRRVVLDITDPHNSEILGGIVPAAITHCDACYTRARKVYDRVTKIPLPAYQPIGGLTIGLNTTAAPPSPVVPPCPIKTEHRIGWWGSMTPYKGLKRAVQITQLVRDLPDKLDVGFLACGMPDLVHADYPNLARGYSKELKVGKVCHIDSQWRPLDVALETMKECDLFVLPSHRQDAQQKRHNHSSAARFLLSLGKPLLVSADPDFDDVREFCFTVPDGSAEKFAMWVRGFLLDASLYAEYAEKAALFGRVRSLAAHSAELRDFLDRVV